MRLRKNILDFVNKEFKKIKNIKIVTLGNRILRAETAGVVLLSILNYELRR